MQGVGIRLAVPYANLGGSVELAHCQPAAAESVLRESYDRLASMNETYHRCDLAAMLAHALCDQGKHDEALHYTDISQAIAAPTDEETHALSISALASGPGKAKL